MLRINAASREYLFFPLAQDEEIDDTTVVVAFVPVVGGDVTLPEEADWKQAQWGVDPAGAKSARIAVGPGTSATWTPGIYRAFLRVTTPGESIVQEADFLEVE